MEKKGRLRISASDVNPVIIQTILKIEKKEDINPKRLVLRRADTPFQKAPETFRSCLSSSTHTHFNGSAELNSSKGKAAGSENYPLAETEADVFAERAVPLIREHTPIDRLLLMKWNVLREFHGDSPLFGVCSLLAKTKKLPNGMRLECLWND
ncbi:hypothetical protein TNIN_495831 [Trichonephila inaurata madagascariensis]|uniref:Uncharacterized protein n=1 Tax=Trichonephila inaurata madagascariensis TaxID=2747483 RepID=A0A8X7C0G3_9ARAC|nr:hypothetical protein TNIN_495831 [Trichonephila inaurata madagascariensis]